MRWQVAVRLKGHKASAVFDRKSDATAWGQKTEAAIREGRSFPERAEQKRTLAELIDRYVRDVLPEK